jgi:hypothetical protein
MLIVSGIRQPLPQHQWQAVCSSAGRLCPDLGGGRRQQCEAIGHHCRRRGMCTVQPKKLATMWRVLMSTEANLSPLQLPFCHPNITPTLSTPRTMCWLASRASTDMRGRRRPRVSNLVIFEANLAPFSSTAVFTKDQSGRPRPLLTTCCCSDRQQHPKQTTKRWGAAAHDFRGWGASPWW